MTSTFQQIFFLLCATCFLFATCQIKVDPKSQLFIDDLGRFRIFHGVNVVYKPFPFYPPVLDHFDALRSLSAEDLQNLRQWGFSTIRLYVSWMGTESVRGKYNETYLNIIDGIITHCAKYDIYVILDVHQDMYHQRYCGHGFPEWASPKVEGAGKFPFPLPFHMTFDNVTGLPLNCGEHPFFEYYFTYATGNAFQGLYSNVNSIRDSFVNFWQFLARRFKNAKNLLGYELINEPWLGNVISHPSLLLSGGKADLENLQPLYTLLHDAIRKEDAKHIIFYEPAVADIEKIGFTQGPGGPTFNDRQALSYHIYCGFMDPKSRILCDIYDDTMFNWRDKAVKRLGGGSFLTEFGFVSDKPAAMAELNWMLDESEKRFLSWAYWQFKFEGSLSFYADNGTLLVEKVKTLARPHVQAMCGTPVESKFNVTSRVYTVKFIATSQCADNVPTVLYASKQFHYPNGVTFTIDPVDSILIQQVDENTYHLTRKSTEAPIGKQISIKLLPK